MFNRLSLLLLLFIAVINISDLQANSNCCPKDTIQSLHNPLTKPLFKEKGMLEITIATNLKELVNDRSDERTYHPGVMTIQQDDGTQKEISLELKTRGNFRRTSPEFNFPPLKLKLDQDEVVNTVFAEQHKLKLVTTGNKRSADYEDYLMREYLAYRIYNQLTESSYKVRMAKITYLDTEGKMKMPPRMAFFLEPTKDMAKRLDGTSTDLKNQSPGVLVEDNFELLSIFQFLIGNTDWSVSQLHNVKMVQNSHTGAFTAVPYDFDWSGMVDSHYAVPAPFLAIDDIKCRHFQGWVKSAETYEKIKSIFLNNQNEIYELVETMPEMAQSSKDDLSQYFDEFYQMLRQDELFSGPKAGTTVSLN